MALTKVIGEGISGVSISANNEITMSSQPAFLAYANTQNNIAVATNVNITFQNERFDQNADFDGTSTFTAPITGRYQLNASVYFGNIDSASGYYYIELNTSNENYYNIIAAGGFSADIDYLTLTLSHIVDMDASDTAKIRVVQSHGTAQTDINANSFFSGYLVC